MFVVAAVCLLVVLVLVLVLVMVVMVVVKKVVKKVGHCKNYTLQANKLHVLELIIRKALLNTQ